MQMPHVEIDYKINLPTLASVVVSLLLALTMGARYVEKQDMRIAQAEQAVSRLEVERTRQSIELQRLSVQIERLSVQIAGLERVVDRQERDRRRQ